MVVYSMEEYGGVIVWKSMVVAVVKTSLGDKLPAGHWME